MITITSTCHNQFDQWHTGARIPSPLDYNRIMNTDTRDDLAAGIRGFVIANPDADFEMVMDYVESQIDTEADDALIDLAMDIMLDEDSK